jgi:site-specific DNA-methyltransferase (adenine-specific)
MNWKDKTVFIGDNLDVMKGMNSESVDLIYLDPPFNSNQSYSAPIGSQAAGAAFKDAWTFDDVKQEEYAVLAYSNPALYQLISTSRATYDESMMAYLIMISIRLMEMKRLLKRTGSVYLHCDPIASHYLKLCMDVIFGAKNFRNELIWRIGWVSGFKTQKRGWIRNHDTILYYVASQEATERFNKEYIPYPEGYLRRDGKPPTGKGIPIEDTWNCSDSDRLDSIMIKSFSKEKTGYPTQKPLALLNRIIKASSNEGDVVFDPFCGCATTLVAADRLRRKWIGIDLSHTAGELVVSRFKEDQGLFQDITHRTDVPTRTDGGGEQLVFPPPTPQNPQTYKPVLFGEQRGRCGACNSELYYRQCTIDHKVPKSKKDGTNEKANLWLLCGWCNSVKGDQPIAYLKERLVEEGIIREDQLTSER